MPHIVHGHGLYLAPTTTMARVTFAERDMIAFARICIGWYAAAIQLAILCVLTVLHCLLKAAKPIFFTTLRERTQ
jgi:hypothetical protein